MHMKRFIGCCVARVLTGFGQSYTAEFEFRPDTGGVGEISVKDMEVELEDQFDRLVNSGEAILTCVINSQQVNAIQALTNQGWTASPWTKKFNHPDTMVSIWYKLVDPQIKVVL
jgi:hypothetical protein